MLANSVAPVCVAPVVTMRGLDLAPYIADARALQLVLLGGSTGAKVEGMTGRYLLTQLGWLRFDRIFGLWAHRLGLLMMIGAVLWAAFQLASRRGHTETARRHQPAEL